MTHTHNATLVSLCFVDGEKTVTGSYRLYVELLFCCTNTRCFVGEEVTCSSNNHIQMKIPTNDAMKGSVSTLLTLIINLYYPLQIMWTDIPVIVARSRGAPTTTLNPHSYYLGVIEAFANEMAGKSRGKVIFHHAST